MHTALLLLIGYPASLGAVLAIDGALGFPLARAFGFGEDA